MAKLRSSVDEQEIAHFSKTADRWWDEHGPFAPLHKLNPARLGFIKHEICTHFGLDFSDLKALKGLDIVDIGCGGGLVCEPLVRLGANVTGIDADARAIAVAKDHAKQSGLSIQYDCKAGETITKKFDVVLALEIIEHVADPAEFVQTCANLVKPGGMVIFSTLNRTPKSYALGIVAAEHVLGWVPKGTHSWKKFVKPSELSRYCRHAGIAPTQIKGLVFNPLTGQFQMSASDVDVNYFLAAAKPA
jgi:2-polyprenyl-6-hydroxyphenyl methylase/3-demethylubiquinone-9 3-methyltransferase